MRGDTRIDYPIAPNISALKDASLLEEEWESFAISMVLLALDKEERPFGDRQTL